MQIRNDTPYEQGLTMGLGPEGKPCMTIVVKATFRLPAAPGRQPELADEQLPITTADEYFDGDTTGSVRLESDAVPFKPRADVVLVGTAYAPGGQPVKMLDVLLRVGPVQKVVRVFGHRSWIFPTRMVMVPLISEPEPFVQMPLRYEYAFGGIDRKAGKLFHQNYVGKGFLGRKIRESVDGKPLPNLEDPAHLIKSWDDEPRPACFGFYSANCQPRVPYAGTERGLQQPHPLFGLPADFRHDFFNGAHPDLQVPGYLRGDEEVELVNLMADGPRRFRLPGVRPLITLHIHGDRSVDVAEQVAVDAWSGAQDSANPPPKQVTTPAKPSMQTVSLEPRLDTLVFLPDEGRFYQVWRAGYALGNLNDVEALQKALLRVSGIYVHTSE